MSAGAGAGAPRLAGVDFTSRPSRRKPITVALGHLTHGVVRLERIDEYRDCESFAQWLATPGPWLGGFNGAR